MLVQFFSQVSCRWRIRQAPLRDLRKTASTVRGSEKPHQASQLVLELFDLQADVGGRGLRLKGSGAPMGTGLFTPDQITARVGAQHIFVPLHFHPFTETRNPTEKSSSSQTTSSRRRPSTKRTPQREQLSLEERLARIIQPTGYWTIDSKAAKMKLHLSKAVQGMLSLPDSLVQGLTNKLMPWILSKV